MSLPFDIVSTDFDGTIHSDFDSSPIPKEFAELIHELQSQGVKWGINTGRDLPSLQMSLDAADIEAKPDFLVLVEREIHLREGDGYMPHEPWNQSCRDEHDAVFRELEPELPRLRKWLHAEYQASVYEDEYSPLCIIARELEHIDPIASHLDDFCVSIPGLTFVRNHVYGRFSHTSYSKGTALSEIGRLWNIPPERIVAAGDHHNDISMLDTQHAGWLIAPSNAVPEVADAVATQGGLVMPHEHGVGVAAGLREIMASA